MAYESGGSTKFAIKRQGTLCLSTFRRAVWAASVVAGAWVGSRRSLVLRYGFGHYGNCCVTLSCVNFKGSPFRSPKPIDHPHGLHCHLSGSSFLCSISFDLANENIILHRGLKSITSGPMKAWALCGIVRPLDKLKLTSIYLGVINPMNHSSAAGRLNCGTVVKSEDGEREAAKKSGRFTFSLSFSPQTELWVGHLAS